MLKVSPYSVQKVTKMQSHMDLTKSLELDNIFRTIQKETAMLKDYTYSEIYL